MSSFLRKFINPKTGKIQVAYCIDDYYSPHEYGYGFRKDGKDAEWKKWSKSTILKCDWYREEELIRPTPRTNASDGLNELNS